jgi:hypothetical protein
MPSKAEHLYDQGNGRSDISSGLGRILGDLVDNRKKPPDPLN